MQGSAPLFPLLISVICIVIGRYALLLGLTLRRWAVRVVVGPYASLYASSLDPMYCCRVLAMLCPRHHIWALCVVVGPMHRHCWALCIIVGPSSCSSHPSSSCSTCPSASLSSRLSFSCSSRPSACFMNHLSSSSSFPCPPTLCLASPPPPHLALPPPPPRCLAPLPPSRVACPSPAHLAPPPHGLASSHQLTLLSSILPLCLLISPPIFSAYCSPLCRRCVDRHCFGVLFRPDAGLEASVRGKGKVDNENEPRQMSWLVFHNSPATPPTLLAPPLHPPSPDHRRAGLPAHIPLERGGAAAPSSLLREPRWC